MLPTLTLLPTIAYLVIVVLTWSRRFQIPAEIAGAVFAAATAACYLASGHYASAGFWAAAVLMWAFFLVRDVKRRRRGGVTPQISLRQTTQLAATIVRHPIWFVRILWAHTRFLVTVRRCLKREESPEVFVEREFLRREVALYRISAQCGVDYFRFDPDVLRQGGVTL